MDKKFVINTQDIAKNVSIIKEKVQNKIVYAVLKGNAYGMELIPFSKELYKCGLRYFSVTDLNDAVALRKNLNDVEILLLTPCKIKEDIYTAISNNISLTVCDLNNAKEISNVATDLNSTVKIQIKIDTGMGRYGFKPNNIEEILYSCKLDNLFVEGIFTHLHSAFAPKENPSLKQFDIFIKTIEKIEQHGINLPIKHICNSTAVFRFPQMHLSAVRTGSALIGRVPEICGKTGLTKIGKLFGQVIDFKVLPKGHNIGYAALYKTKKEQKIACVNVGYSDGVSVTKANDTFRFIDILRYIFNDIKLVFLKPNLICRINNIPLKSLGRIGMTNLVLDANNINEISVGDTVEIPVNPIYLSPTVKREYI